MNGQNIGESVTRRYTFKLYPSESQAEALERQRRMHCDLYNALLQQRIDYYRGECERHGKTTARGMTMFDQNKELTALRAADCDFASLSYDSLGLTLKRLDDAYKAFFRRAKAGAGAQSGFPRFKSGRTYPGFSFRNKKGKWNGWRWGHKPPRVRKNGKVKGWRDGRFYFKGIPGTVRAKGELPCPPEKIVCCDVLWRDGNWWVSLVVEIPPRGRKGSDDVRIDLDLIDSFAEISASRPHGAGPGDGFLSSDGRIGPENHRGNATSAEVAPDLEAERGVIRFPARLRKAEVAPDLEAERGPSQSLTAAHIAEASPDLEAERGSIAASPPVSLAEATPGLGGRIDDIQRAMARCKRGSNRYRKLRRQKARIEARQARRRREALHELSTGIIRQSKSIILSKPDIKEITRSGRGDVRHWGAAVKLKARVNRHILDFAPGEFTAMLEYKADEAGCEFTVVEQGDESEAVIGNLVVEAVKENRKLKRTIKNARRSR